MPLFVSLSMPGLSPKPSNKQAQIRWNVTFWKIFLFPWLQNIDFLLLSLVMNLLIYIWPAQVRGSWCRSRVSMFIDSRQPQGVPKPESVHNCIFYETTLSLLLSHPLAVHAPPLFQTSDLYMSTWILDYPRKQSLLSLLIYTFHCIISATPWVTLCI